MYSGSKFIKKLQKIGSSRVPKTHTPIHAGQNNFLPTSFNQLFKLDLSEITGLDDLHHPRGIIDLAQKKAAALFQVDKTFFSVNGASGCLTSACLALGEGGKVLVPRNVHKSVIAGLILSGAEPLWYEPAWDSEWGVYRQINLNEIAELIKQNKNIKGCFVTSPTYEGIQTKTEDLIALCHEHDIPVVADESHGAHISLLNNGLGAVNACADLIVHSAHKTLGSLTQTGMLHFQSDILSVQKVASCMSLMQTTSPSFLLLASLAETIESLAQNLKPLKQQWFLAQEFQKRLQKVKGLQILQNDDPTRCVISLEGWPGHELSDWLQDNYGLETELENEKWVMFMVGFGFKWHHMRYITKALEAAFNYADKPDFPIGKISRNESFIQRVSPRQGFFESDNSKIVFQCPPGIPTEIPGMVKGSAEKQIVTADLGSEKQVANAQFVTEKLKPEVLPKPISNSPKRHLEVVNPYFEEEFDEDPFEEEMVDSSDERLEEFAEF
jgi:arginine decarboxylase